MLQHGSYTLLIDACYDREEFPTLEQAIEWTWASTTEEIEAITFVLHKFFTLENGVFVQKRIQEELNEYHSKSEINTRIAIERETKRKENSTKRVRVVNAPSPGVNEPPPNQEPLTTNHKPIVGSAKRRTQLPDEFFPDETGLKAATKKSVSVDDELPKFKDFHKAKGSVMLDWQAAWRTWCSNAVKFAPRYSAANPTSTIPMKPGIDPALAKCYADAKICKPMPVEMRRPKRELFGAAA